MDSPVVLKVSRPLYDRLNYLTINDTVKMNVGEFFIFSIRATGTCTCWVSAVVVKLITIQYFDIIQNFYRDLSIKFQPLLKSCWDDCRTFLVAWFSAFNFKLRDCDISIKKNTNNLCNGNARVVWHSMKTLVNFTGR